MFLGRSLTQSGAPGSPLLNQLACHLSMTRLTEGAKVTDPIPSPMHAGREVVGFQL
jgi:hypothetical protein